MTDKYVPIRATSANRQTTRMELARLRRVPPLSEDQAEQVLMLLAQGMRITHIGNVPDLPAYAVINAWRRQYPWFDEACVEASQAGAEAMLWATIEIADDTERAPACRDVSIKARQFAMKVLDRKRFDPATKVEVRDATADADELSDDDLARIVRQAEKAKAEDIETLIPGREGVARGRGGENEIPPHHIPRSKKEI